MNIIYFGASAAVLLLLSCSSSKQSVKTSETTLQHTSIVCADLVANPENIRIDWQKVTNIPTTDPPATLPARYTAYTLDHNQIASFFKKSKESGKPLSIAIPMPKPLGCQPFSLAAGSNPMIATLKGSAINDASAQLSLSYDGSYMNGQLKWGDKNYVISHTEVNSQVYYLLYEQADMPEVNKPVQQSTERKLKYVKPSNMMVSPTTSN